MPNPKRGFHRVFIVLAVLWAVFCLIVYPMQQRVAAEESYDKGLQNCYQYDLGKGEVFTDCLKSAEKLEQLSLEPWSAKNFYIGEFWPLLLVVVGVPSVVYILCRGLAALSLWIVRGFTSHA